MKYAYTASYTTENGTNRYPAGQGVHVFSLSENDTVWTEIQEIPENNPAFIEWGKDKKVIYVAQSGSPVPLTGINAYSVDPATGKLSKMAQQVDFGTSICCLSVHPDHDYLVAADFKGNLYAVSLNEDGSLKEITDKQPTQGQCGPLGNDQKCSRPHHIPFDLDGNFIVIPDKGFDVVHVYELSHETGKLNLVSQTAVRPASCARHMAFHPNRRYAYLAAEYTSKVYVFDYDSVNGTLERKQIISSDRTTFTGTYTKNSEIAVHPNGKFLYVSNRGDNTIAIFRIDGDTGTLTPLGWEDIHGEIPRFFCIDDNGTRLFLGNQKTGCVILYDIDPETGMLKWNEKPIPVPCPTWILFS